MKDDILKIYGVFLLFGAIVWTGFRALPYVGYRYKHTDLTETQLQIYFLSQVCWWDLVPILLAVLGMVLLNRSVK